MALYITGDTHRRFDRVYALQDKVGLYEGDVLIILGDVGINYYGNKKDYNLKKELSKLPIELFCIKGNHENYAGNIKSYKLVDYKGGKAWIEKEFPNLVFAKDGEIYEFEVNGEKRTAIVIGGAYSVDKYYRLAYGMRWFKDEQPSEETKRFVEEQLEKVNWEVDYVLSHTAPLRYQPREWFLPMIDQDTVDTSTEEWLDEIYTKIKCRKWYCGHYHGEEVIDNMVFMYESINLLR